MLVSAVGAIPEVIADRQSGMLVAPRDAGSLATALAEIVEDRETAAAPRGRGI